ncbi:MAG: hypothetical protein Q7R87_02970 [Nanoarchaeota archaeon]|nr:hypothetical protein [Nanoarchaeota archaeon]
MEQIEINVPKSARSPNLDTIKMVEEFIKESVEEYTKTQLFESLPKKMMWGTFNAILKYLTDINHIGFDRHGVIVYLYNPELAERLKNRKSY